MKTFTLALILLTIFVTRCSTGDIKYKPEYKGVDPSLQHLVNEYMYLSVRNNIDFHKDVTIGFKNLTPPTVGQCTYGGWFREIDIDVTYWNIIGNIDKMTLIFHELSHCYCGRAHDYGNGISYPASSDDRIKDLVRWMIRGGSRPGYWNDGCPTSILYPSVVDDTCMYTHYEEYTTEMFNRCNPW